MPKQSNCSGIRGSNTDQKSRTFIPRKIPAFVHSYQRDVRITLWCGDCQSEEWYEGILASNLDEARVQLERILRDTETDENGCMVSPTKLPRKVRLFGGQDRAYRYVFCIANRRALTRDQVVRHRCHNRRCMNPEHLEVGSRADNIQDERDRKANGIAYELL